MDRETFKIRSTESEPWQIADCRLQIEKIKTSILNLKSEIRESPDCEFLYNPVWFRLCRVRIKIKELNKRVDKEK